MVWGLVAALPAVVGVLACIAATSLLFSQRTLLDGYRRIATSRQVSGLPQEVTPQLQWRVQFKHTTDVLASRLYGLLIELQALPVKVEVHLYVDGQVLGTHWTFEGPAKFVAYDVEECVRHRVCGTGFGGRYMSHLLSDTLAGEKRHAYAVVEATCWVMRVPRVILHQVEVLPPELEGLTAVELLRLRDQVRAEAEVKSLTG